MRELVVFFVDERPGRRLRAWDRIENDLVERVVKGDATPCVTLPELSLLVGPVDQYPVGLRIARAKELVLTDKEAASRERSARQRAEARVIELEREIAAARRRRPTSG